MVLGGVAVSYERGAPVPKAKGHQIRPFPVLFLEPTPIQTARVNPYTNCHLFEQIECANLARVQILKSTVCVLFWLKSTDSVSLRSTDFSEIFPLAACERRGNNLKRFSNLGLRVNAKMCPWLSYV